MTRIFEVIEENVVLVGTIDNIGKNINLFKLNINDGKFINVDKMDSLLKVKKINGNFIVINNHKIGLLGGNLL